MDSKIECFKPIAREDTKVLILGSIPGIKSLEKMEYYGHGRNAFWYILSEILGFDKNLPYEERIKKVINNHIAIWDVISSCKREGSLDSAIEDIVPNDFSTFFRTHSEIRHIFFNGQKALKEYKKLVLPKLEKREKEIMLTLLPSTSPANAGMTRDEKLKEWKKILKVLNA